MALLIFIDAVSSALLALAYPVISGYITVFISITWLFICIPISSMLPSIFIMEFIIFMPSKYFNLGNTGAFILDPEPNHKDVAFVRSSEVALNSKLLFSGI